MSKYLTLEQAQKLVDENIKDYIPDSKFNFINSMRFYTKYLDGKIITAHTKAEGENIVKDVVSYIANKMIPITEKFREIV